MALSVMLDYSLGPIIFTLVVSCLWFAWWVIQEINEPIEVRHKSPCADVHALFSPGMFFYFLFRLVSSASPVRSDRSAGQGIGLALWIPLPSSVYVHENHSFTVFVFGP